MIGFQLGRLAGSGLTLLCLGAHADDIEIGCGGTIRELLQARADVSGHWVVFSGSAARAREARRSAELFLRGARSHEVQLHDFQDGFFLRWRADQRCFRGAEAVHLARSDSHAPRRRRASGSPATFTVDLEHVS
jgi:LmbE family N-acetylglucosaminyl deacetylase